MIILQSFFQGQEEVPEMQTSQVPFSYLLSPFEYNDICDYIKNSAQPDTRGK